MFQCRCIDSNIKDDLGAIWNEELNTLLIKECNKYLGSINNAKNRIAALTLMDSIIVDRRIEITDIKISNWNPSTYSPYIKGFESLIMYDFLVNNKIGYRFSYNRRNNKFDEVLYPIQKLFFYRNAEFNSREVSEYFYMHIEIRRDSFILKDSYMHCDPNGFL